MNSERFLLTTIFKSLRLKVEGLRAALDRTERRELRSHYSRKPVYTGQRSSPNGPTASQEWTLPPSNIK